MNEVIAARQSIRPATGDHAGLLSALALRSKAHWGYDADFMRACRSELTYSAHDIVADCYEFFVCYHGNSVTGFYALDFTQSQNVELEALFVEPQYIGHGIGRALLRHAIERARTRGGEVLLIQGDPHAEGFYLAAGARRTGSRDSCSVPGRALPLFQIALGHQAHE